MQDYRWVEFQRNLSALTNSFYCLTAEDKPHGITAMRECLGHMQSALKQQLCSDGMRTVAAMAESLIQETYGIPSEISQPDNRVHVNSCGVATDVFLTNQNNAVIINDVNFHQSSSQDSNLSFATITLDAPPVCHSTSSLLNCADSTMDIMCCTTNPVYETLKNARCHHPTAIPQTASAFITDFDNYEHDFTNHNNDNGRQLDEPWDFTNKCKADQNGNSTIACCSFEESCAQNSFQPLQCQKCPFTTAYRQSMHRHTKIHDVTSSTDRSNVLSSNASNATFENNHNQSNQQTREDGRKYPCPHCGKRFKTKSGLNEHCSYLHPRKWRSVDDSDASDNANYIINRPFVCEECTKSFPLKKDLNRHTRVTHSDARPFQCHCGKAYKTKYHLTRHASATHHILVSS